MGNATPLLDRMKMLEPRPRLDSSESTELPHRPENHHTYPKSSLISFFDASKGTFRTRILELVCFLVEADLRCVTFSLKKKKTVIQKLNLRDDHRTCMSRDLNCVLTQTIFQKRVSGNADRLTLVLLYALGFVQNNRATNLTNQIQRPNYT